MNRMGEYSLSKATLQGTTFGRTGGGGRGVATLWSAEKMHSVKEWASLPMPELLKMASRRKDWKRISAEASLKHHDDPVRQGTELTNGNNMLYPNH